MTDAPDNVASDWLISVDDHVLEPADLWQRRMSAADREQAPKLVRDGDSEFWVYEGRKVYTSGLSAVVGKRKDEFSPVPISYDEMRPGCYDPVARLADMDQAGILASMCFPSFTRFCGQIFWEAKDKDLALRCLRTYNDWMIDEWCGSAPGRYIPLTLIPLWDPALAAAEVERCAAKGSRAIAFSENPAPLGLPTIFDRDRYWDPVMKAAEECQLVVAMHVGSSSEIPKIMPDAPVVANKPWADGARTSGVMLAWIFSGIFDRMPNLKIAMSEGGIGWIPYFLERAEQVVSIQRYWASRVKAEAAEQRDFGKSGTADAFMRAVESEVSPVDLLTLDVRQTFRDHIFGCFIVDNHGVRSIKEIGVENVMIETDYPHSDSTWPNCIKIAKEQVADLPADQQQLVLRGNAERLFRFTPAEPPSPGGR